MDPTPAPTIDAGQASVTTQPAWHALTRISFRLAFCYILLYNFESFLGSVSSLVGQIETWIRGIFTDTPASVAYSFYPVMWVKEGSQWLVVWIAKNVFGERITVFPNGSGDTTFNYIQVATYASLAGLAAILWSAFDFRRTHYTRLHSLLRIYIRYTLAFTMLSYGMAKVFPLQFPAPDVLKLTQTYGEASPMGILWTFMGSSAAYTMFAGYSEAIGGLLLFWRRTTFLGAIVVAGVMANVVALNFCYDVPVKLYSSHLFLQAIVLMAPEMGRLCTLLFTDRALPPRTPTRGLSRPILHRWWIGLKSALVAGFMVLQVIEGLHAYSEYGPGAKMPPLYGLYTVEEFNRGDIPVPPLAGDMSRWGEVVVDRIYPASWGGDGTGAFRARTVDRIPIWYRYRLDEQARTLTLTLSAPGRRPQPGATAPELPDLPSTLVFNYKETDPDRLTLEGKMGEEPVEIKLKRIPLDSFQLKNRGFRWINEYPYNR